MAKTKEKKDEGKLFAPSRAGTSVEDSLRGWKSFGDLSKLPGASAKRKDLKAAGKGEQKPPEPQKAVEASIELHGKLNPKEEDPKKKKQQI